MKNSKGLRIKSERSIVSQYLKQQWTKIEDNYYIIEWFEFSWIKDELEGTGSIIVGKIKWN